MYVDIICASKCYGPSHNIDISIHIIYIYIYDTYVTYVYVWLPLYIYIYIHLYTRLLGWRVLLHCIKAQVHHLHRLWFGLCAWVAWLAAGRSRVAFAGLGMTVDTNNSFAVERPCYTTPNRCE